MVFTPRSYSPFDSYGKLLVLPEGRRVAYEARAFKWIDSNIPDDFCGLLESHQAEIETIFRDIQEQSKLADCERRRMGCVVTDTLFRVAGRGHNGKPKGVDGKCQTIGCIPSLTCRLTLHAEQSALNEIPKTIGEEFILFCSSVPCLDCYKICLSRGVVAVVYEEERDQPEYDRPILSALTTQGRISCIKVENLPDIARRVECK